MLALLALVPLLITAWQLLPEFTKQTGRTTGSLSLSASRESRADAAVNLRSTSWNIPVGLTSAVLIK